MDTVIQVNIFENAQLKRFRSFMSHDDYYDIHKEFSDIKNLSASMLAGVWAVVELDL
jgi:hypothetical protein